MNRKRSEEQGREVQRIVGLAAVAVGSASNRLREIIFSEIPGASVTRRGK